MAVPLAAVFGAGILFRLADLEEEGLLLVLEEEVVAGAPAPVGAVEVDEEVAAAAAKPEAGATSRSTSMSRSSA